MTRDKVILLDGSLRGGALSFMAISLVSILRWDVILSLVTIGLAVLFLTMSSAVGWAFKDMDLPS